MNKTAFRNTNGVGSARFAIENRRLSNSSPRASTLELRGQTIFGGPKNIPPLKPVDPDADSVLANGAFNGDATACVQFLKNHNFSDEVATRMAAVLTAAPAAPAAPVDPKLSNCGADGMCPKCKAKMAKTANMDGQDTEDDNDDDDKLNSGKPKETYDGIMKEIRKKK